MNLLKTMSQLVKPESKSVASSENGAGRTAYATPLANILETKDAYVLEAEIPGVAKDGLEVTVENGQLTIVGRRANHATNGNTLYRESRANDYRRVFEVDSSIDTGRITAKVDQGVLTLTLPKAEAVKPRKITVG
jgi:HSP20 family protein